MPRWGLALPVALLLFSPSVADAQACLHGRVEMGVERDRRLEALRAARIINSAQAWEARGGQYLPWPRLGGAGYVVLLRGDGGPSGELVRRMNWGAADVLPGWRIHFVVSGEAYAFSLRDAQDPCGFTYSSDESGVVLEGYPVERDGSTPRRATP